MGSTPIESIVLLKGKIMSGSTRTVGGGGIGLGGLMSIILVVLKILDKIDMSWFWVISSLIWIPLIIISAMIIVVLIFAVIAIVLDSLF